MSGRWGGPEATTLRRRARMDELALLVAEETPLRECARIIGVSHATVTSLMAQMRRDLGWQAS